MKDSGLSGRGSDHRPERGGFTLVELLVSMAILGLIVVLIASITDHLAGIWQRTAGTVAQWQSARLGFDTMNRRISRATLNTTWAYYDGPNGTGNLTNSDPKSYGRASDLHFVVGPAATLLPGVPNTTTQAVFFQAPLGRTNDHPTAAGLPQILNSCGFFVQFNDGADFQPDFPLFAGLPGKSRFRLMEWVQPSEAMAVSSTAMTGWLAPVAAEARPLAENVIALIILPLVSQLDVTSNTLLAPNYLYDSRESRTFSSPGLSGNTLHQLPPLLQITMVAIDAKSADRIEKEFNGAFPASLFAGVSFSSASEYSNDIGRLEDNLRDADLTHRVFTSTIAIRGAKWSGD